MLKTKTKNDNHIYSLNDYKQISPFWIRIIGLKVLTLDNKTTNHDLIKKTTSLRETDSSTFLQKF